PGTAFPPPHPTPKGLHWATSPADVTAAKGAGRERVFDPSTSPWCCVPGMEDRSHRGQKEIKAAIGGRPSPAAQQRQFGDLPPEPQRDPRRQTESSSCKMLLLTLRSGLDFSREQNKDSEPPLGTGLIQGFQPSRGLKSAFKRIASMVGRLSVSQEPDHICRVHVPLPPLAQLINILEPCPCLVGEGGFVLSTRPPLSLCASNKLSSGSSEARNSAAFDEEKRAECAADVQAANLWLEILQGSIQASLIVCS
ncbi:unnamed protein product, partial [Pleuronectes platessa]